MAVISNTRSTVERNEIFQKEYWDNRLLEIIKLNSSNYVFVNLGREVTIPKNEGTLTISMRRYNSLPIRALEVGAVDSDGYTTGEALSEGTPNSPLKVEAQKVQASVGQYGAWISISDHVQDIHLDDIKSIYQPELADHAAKIRELDVLEQLSADASEKWVGGVATSNSELVAPGTEGASVLTIQDGTVLVNALSGNINITLPSVSQYIGSKFNIKKIDISGHNVTIRANNVNIDGSNTVIITQQYTSLTFTSDGNQWWII